MIISRTPLRISFAGGGTDLCAFYGRERGAGGLGVDGDAVPIGVEFGGASGSGLCGSSAASAASLGGGGRRVGFHGHARRGGALRG